MLLPTYFAFDPEELIAQNTIPNPNCNKPVSAAAVKPCLKRRRDRAPSPEELGELVKPKVSFVMSIDKRACAENYINCSA